MARLTLMTALAAAAGGGAETATLCDSAGGLPAPNVTTVMVSPNDSSVAWVLAPDCTLDERTVVPNPLGVGELKFTGMDIVRIESLPPGTQRLFIENTFLLRDVDFSPFKNLSHIIQSYSNVTSIDGYKFPNSLGVLDLDGNAVTGIAEGVIPPAVVDLYLSNNKISSFANFHLPTSLQSLYLFENNFKSIDFAIPEGLDKIDLSKNTIVSLENFTMPDSLTQFICTNCAIRRIRNVHYSPRLLTLDLDYSRVTQFEANEAEFSVLQGLEVLNLNSAVSSCSDPNAKPEMAKNATVCVTSESSSSSSSTSEPSSPSSSSSSSPVLIIVLSVVGAILVVGIAFFLWRRSRRSKNLGENPDDKYADAGNTATAEFPASSTKASGVSSASGSSQEYLSNDVRNDEALIPFRIGHDEILVVRELAKGGYGVVKLGKFRGRDVAVKQLLSEKSREMSIIKSFMDEIRLSSKLEHPKIVEFIGLTWSTLRDIAVVSEYMAGGDLSAVLRSIQGAPEPRDWFEPTASLPPKTLVALDVIEALVYLHSFNSPIIHRDLKARNVLLDKKGNAKLSDFGISREMSLDETMTGEVGTVAWIAPEVLQGERYGEKADIYSLGVLLSELDTCRHPYSQDTRVGMSPQANARIAVLVSTGQLSPQLSLDSPPQIQSLIGRCLRYDPVDRPSAVEIHYELRRIRQEHTLNSNAQSL